MTTFGGARGLQFFLLEYTVFQLKISGVVPDDVQTVERKERKTRVSLVRKNKKK